MDNKGIDISNFLQITYVDPGKNIDFKVAIDNHYLDYTYNGNYKDMLGEILDKLRLNLERQYGKKAEHKQDS